MNFYEATLQALGLFSCIFPANPSSIMLLLAIYFQFCINTLCEGILYGKQNNLTAKVA